MGEAGDLLKKVLPCETEEGKSESQRKWVEANPDYFNGRYENTKQWRKEHPGYQRKWRSKRREIQDEIRPAKPVKIIRLAIPEVMLRGEIQK
jgi:hypothetical protein